MFIRCFSLSFTFQNMVMYFELLPPRNGKLTISRCHTLTQKTWLKHSDLGITWSWLPITLFLLPYSISSSRFSISPTYIEEILVPLFFYSFNSLSPAAAFPLCSWSPSTVIRILFTFKFLSSTCLTLVDSSQEDNTSTVVFLWCFLQLGA